MKILKNLSIFFIAIILFSQVANAQIIITKLGTHPFYKPSLTSKSDLFSMIGYNVDDIEKGFELAGMSYVFDDFIDQVFDTKITKVNLGDGTKLEWMFHRKYGKGPVLLARNITWINKEAIEAYQFNIDSNGKRYTFVVPFICSNLSLRGVTGIPLNDAYYLKNTELEEGAIGSIAIDSDDYKNDSNSQFIVNHGIDLDGDETIDAKVDIAIDDDGTIDYYDVDGDGSIDVKAGATATAVTGAKAASLSKNTKVEKEHECGEDCTEKHIYCGKPGWKLGIHGGFPLGSAPDDESFNMGLLLETPLGVKLGPLNIGLGLGAFTYDFENIYFGGGALASLCINELLKLDMPIKLQLHGAGFYVFGEESGPGFGVIASASLPLGNTPLGLGVFYGGGKYYPGEKDYNWANIGAVLFYDF